jgi:hypothetical protein
MTMRIAPLAFGVLVPLLTLLGSSEPAHASARAPVRTEVVVGVAEEGSGKPIAGAQVYFPELRRAAYTDWMGEARTAIDLPLFLMARRRQMGIGRFITDSVLLAHRSDALSFVLQQRLPGLNVYQGVGITSLVFSSGRNCRRSRGSRRRRVLSGRHDPAAVSVAADHARCRPAHAALQRRRVALEPLEVKRD